MLKAASATKLNSKLCSNFASIKAKKSVKLTSFLKKLLNKATSISTYKASLKAASKPISKLTSKPITKKTSITKKKELLIEFINLLSNNNTAIKITIKENKRDNIKVEKVSNSKKERAKAKEQSKPKNKNVTYINKELPISALSYIVSLYTSSSKYTTYCYLATNK
ncbi:hypothetical protein HBI72_240020 [Parastagonospora nodorum]|nr:hypothetical protein HBI72_240020 [Parastagonospora nodorum]